MINSEQKFVSRGGLKLQHALDTFKINVKDKIVLDIGSSTGGFVDCLLQNDAAKVFSVDTAYGELAWKLRQNPRVIVMERINILFLNDLPEKVDLITIDVTFTSLSKILPVVKKFLTESGEVIALLKPQYEDQKVALAHHGVVPVSLHPVIIGKIIALAVESGYEILGKTESPILGTGGNREYLLDLKSN